MKARQVSHLPFEDQERAVANMRARGALPPPVNSMTDAAPDPDRMACAHLGHTRVDVVIDPAGIECCGRCSPVPYLVSEGGLYLGPRPR